MLHSMIALLVLINLVNMSRKQIGDISEDERRKIIGDLFDIVTNLKTKKETIGFMMGLLSPSEILMLARRIQIAQMLLKEKNYREICEEISVSQSTVASVARWLYDENNTSFYKQIKKQVLEDCGTKSKKYYNNILSPYGQLNVLKELINNKM